MTEDWPARPATHLFYAQEKAEIERLLSEEAAGHPGLYLLRPPIVLGPDAVGAKSFVRGPLAPLVRWIIALAGRLPLPVMTLPVPIQFIHEEDRPPPVGGVDVAPSDHGREQSQAGTQLAPAVQQPRGAAPQAEQSLDDPLPEDREAPLLDEPIHSVLDR